MSETITATVSVEGVVSALKLNDTNGVDDRVIAVPQRDGAEASIRPAFTGTERYSNPESAPVHIPPESLVEDAWTRPPRRSHVDLGHMDVPELVEERSEADEERIDEALDVLMDNWKTDVRRMIERDHEFKAKDTEITLRGEEKND